MLNRVQIIGFLGADPEVRSFNNGNKVCNLRIATSESWKDKSTGEKREKTEWHTVAIFQEGLVRIAEQYLHKGSKVFLEGKLQTRKWQDQSGADRYSTEIVLQGFDGTLTLLDPKKQGNDSGRPSQPSQSYGQHQPPRQQQQPPIDHVDDEIPF